MKRLFALALLAFTSIAFSATLTPIQLLNPAGSTSGQVITSTGASSPPTWSTVTLSGLGGLAKASNLSDVASVSTSRTNLGLGTASTQNTGTSGATVPLLNAANTWAAAQTFSVRPTFNGATPWDSTNLPSPTSFPAALTTYTPTVTASSGTFTATTPSGRYYQLGKFVFFEVTVVITTVGTASGNVVVTLPFATNTSGGVVSFSGRETTSTGKMLSAFSSASATTMAVTYYDNTSAIAAGATLVVSGCYLTN